MMDAKLIRIIPYSTKKIQKALLILGGVWVFLLVAGCLAGVETLNRLDFLFILGLLAVLFIFSLGVYFRLCASGKYIEVFDDRISIWRPFAKIANIIRLSEIKDTSLCEHESLKRGKKYVLWVITHQFTEKLDDYFLDAQDLRWLEAFIKDQR